MAYLHHPKTRKSDNTYGKYYFRNKQNTLAYYKKSLTYFKRQNHLIILVLSKTRIPPNCI